MTLACFYLHLFYNLSVLEGRGQVSINHDPLLKHGTSTISSNSISFLSQAQASDSHGLWPFASDLATSIIAGGSIILDPAACSSGLEIGMVTSPV